MFKLESKFAPSGDQPKAIKELVDGLNEGKKTPGFTGSYRNRKDFYNRERNKRGK